MKRVINNNRNTQKFTVAVNHINKSRALLPFILNDKMGEFAMKSVKPLAHLIDSKPNLFRINILKNAFLNDVLRFKSKILKLDEEELHLKIEVIKELKNNNDTICVAHYSFKLKPNTVGKAS